MSESGGPTMSYAARVYYTTYVTAGGHGTFSNLVNNLVHVIMYFYYMLSAMGPQYQKYLWWKKHLTTLQLVSSLINDEYL